MQGVENYELDPTKPQIIFILGGPGSGKGTQCERLVRDYHFEHISVGDVIREIVARGGDEAAKLQEIMSKGELVPDQFVVDGLIETIKFRKAHRFLIDGFPRNVEQAQLFEKTYNSSEDKQKRDVNDSTTGSGINMIVNIVVDEQSLIDRCLKRGLTGARADDNEETIKNRIKVFNEKTAYVSEYYKKFGKIKAVNGNQSVDAVYADVQNAIKPNVIFFMGPPAVGKSTVARILAKKLRYHYVDFQAFYKQYKCKSQEDMSNALMKYCSDVPRNCIIVDQFFTDHETAEVFFKHFVKPQFLFYLDSPKDEVFMNISKYYTCPKMKKFQQNVYNQYVQDRVGLLKLVKDQPYFKNINAANSIDNIVKQVFETQKPLTLVSFDHHNYDTACNYYSIMEKERAYMHCDMDELMQGEVNRGTDLGNQVSSFEGKNIANNYQVELVQEIMFNEPDNTKFVFTNWPKSKKDFAHFEKELFPIDYLLNFTQPEEKKPEYQFKYAEDPYLNYFAKGKVININREAIDILDSYTTPRSRYGFITGPQAGGKSTISKHIAAQFDYELVDFTNEAFIEKVKAKYIKEEDEVQEVSYKHIQQYFVERLDPSVPSKTVVFDSWPYESDLQQFIASVGLPSFVVNLRVNKEPLIKRYKEKNEMEKEAELGEEDQQKLADFLTKDEENTKYWTELSQKNFGTKLYNVNGDLPLESTKRYVNQIFQKRVFLVSDYLDYRVEGQPEFSHKSLTDIRNDQRLIFLNLCASKDITFVDVAQLLQNHFEGTSGNTEIKNQYLMRWTNLNSDFPSNYTPQLILQVIQNFLGSLANQTRDVLLYNYPTSDAPVDKNKNEQVYPRASDELKLIEDQLGPVRMLTVLTKERVEHQIQDPVWEMEKPEVKEKPKEGEGEEGEEAEKEAEPEDEGEEGKPKFNVFDYSWTKSDGCPKSLPQWYVKTRKTVKKHYSLQNTESSFDCLVNYLALIDEECEQNKEEEDFRKRNLFVQLRYDQVDEENEEEPPEPESEKEEEKEEEDEEEVEKKEGEEGEKQEGEGEAAEAEEKQEE